MEILANRIRTCRTSVKEKLHILCFMQDGFLKTSHNTNPKYLPNAYGGTNCTPLFENHINLFMYMKGYKGGGQADRIYGTVTNEVRNILREVTLDNPINVKLLWLLNLREKYLHGTYDDKVMLPSEKIDGEYKYSGFTEKNILPAYKGDENSLFIEGLESRLSKTHLVIPELSAQIELRKVEKLTKNLQIPLSERAEM